MTVPRRTITTSTAFFNFLYFLTHSIDSNNITAAGNEKFIELLMIEYISVSVILSNNYSQSKGRSEHTHVIFIHLFFFYLQKLTTDT